jgi:isoprenylcysteine carboxyl methyltransferase (ICMT) family protein YpbQ
MEMNRSIYKSYQWVMEQVSLVGHWNTVKLLPSKHRITHVLYSLLGFPNPHVRVMEGISSAPLWGMLL